MFFGLSRWAHATAILAILGVAASAEAATPSVLSPDIGAIGPIWPIREPDLLDELLTKARHKQKDGEAAALKHKLHDRAEAYAAAPPSLQLPRAQHDGSKPFDPSITMPDDIRDAQGRVLIVAGTRVNPLKTFAFDETLLFVDGADLEQVAWLRRRLTRKHDILAKVVLTDGSPATLSRQLGLAVFSTRTGS